MYLRLGLAALLVAFAATMPATASAATSLGAFWHLNENKGSVAADDSANANHGTVTGATRITGRFVRGLRFDGIDDKVSVPRSSSLEPANLTVEGWLRAPASPGPYKHIISQGASDCGSASYGLYTGGGGGLIFYIAAASATFTLSPDAGAAIWDNQWHHVAGTFDGSIVHLYVDGVQVGTGTPTNLTIGYPFSLPDGFIGGFGTDCVSPITNENLNYKGDIDEVRIWGRAMDSTEVAASTAMGGPSTSELDEFTDSGQSVAYTKRFSDGNAVISTESATGTERITAVRLVALSPLTARATCRNDQSALLNSLCNISLSNGDRTASVNVRPLLLRPLVTLRVSLSSGRTFEVQAQT